MLARRRRIVHCAPVPLHLTADDGEAYAAGCALLGSGGGGDVRSARHLLDATLGRSHRLPSRDVRDLSRGTVALVGAVGSPTVMTERLPSGEEFAAAITRLEATTGRRIDAVAPLEIGGVNGLLGVIAAAQSGRVLLDADGMGRAFPRLDQCVLTGHVPAVPMALVDPSGGSLVIEGVRTETLERTVRAVLPAMGTWAAVACYLTDVDTFARYAVLGSIGRALALGRELLEGGGPQLAEAASGTVLDIVRDDTHRPHGIVTLVDEMSDGAVVRIDHAEEFVSLLRDGVPTASAPDVIAVVDARTWRTLAVSDLRVGQRVRVLVIPAPSPLPQLTQTHGLTAYGLEVA